MKRIIPSILRGSVLLVFLWACVSFSPASAEIKLPHVLGDNMVLQRGIPFSFWGQADPGEMICLRIGRKEFRTQAGKNGNWMVKLPPMEAGGPHQIAVEGSNTILLKNVFVGEVWICSGQSNMEWPVRAVDKGEEEIAAANYPQIRLFHVAKVPSGQPQFDVGAAWCPCHPVTVRDFSAVAYFFGRMLHKELGVPVGLINTSWGGTRIEPWTPPCGFASVPELKEVVHRIEAVEREFREALASSLDSVEAWVHAVRKALAEGDPVPPMPPLPPHPLSGPHQPTGLYNGMVHPITPFAIRGAIWYQGEANREDGMKYCDKMKALINGWRSVWGQGDFPFYFVQLAPFRYGGDPFMLPAIWEAQRAALSVPNTGMAVTTDIGNVQDIHPRNKQDVGKRLALWALAKTYGQEGLAYSGPLYRSVSPEGKRIRIHFDHAGAGLASRDGKPLTCFEIAGEDKNFVKAHAEIEGSTLLVWSDEIQKPVAVRFGWHQEAEPNLMNKEGLPASPFIGDAVD